MAEIIFNEEKIQETIQSLQSLMEEFEKTSHHLKECVNALAEKNEIPRLTEKMIRQHSQCEQRREELAELVGQLKKIKAVYTRTETNNIRLVEELPEFSSEKAGKKSGNIFAKSDDALAAADFSMRPVIAGSVLNGHTLQHEDWLLAAIENYI